MIRIDDIYVSTTASLLWKINIHRCKKNTQHYMLANPYFDKISIDSYKREILPILMLEDGVYITLPLNRLYVEVIANIQC